jgi:hypothetical protein
MTRYRDVIPKAQYCTRVRIISLPSDFLLLELHCLVHEDEYGDIYICVLGADFVVGVEVTSLHGNLPMTTLICIPPYAPYYGANNA